MLEIHSYRLNFVDKTDFDLGPIEYYFTRFFQQKYEKTITKQELFCQYVKLGPTKFLVRNNNMKKYQYDYEVNIEDIKLTINIVYETNGKSCSSQINVYSNKIEDSLTKVVELIRQDLTEYCEYINQFYTNPSIANTSLSTQ